MLLKEILDKIPGVATVHTIFYTLVYTTFTFALRHVHIFFQFFHFSMYYVHICMSVIWLYWYLYLKWRKRMVGTDDIYIQIECDLINAHSGGYTKSNYLVNVFILWKFGKYPSLLSKNIPVIGVNCYTPFNIPSMLLKFHSYYLFSWNVEWAKKTSKWILS